MLNDNNNYENKYIYNILQINKSLRNEIEVVYKLLRKKLKMENCSSLNKTIEKEKQDQSNTNNIIKLNNLINEFEIILSNLGIQMESHNELIITLNTIEEKYKTIKTNTNLMNQINELQKKINVLSNKNNEYKVKYENVLKELDLNKKNYMNMKKTNEFLNKENIDLRLQIERTIKEKKEMFNIISQVETMGNKLKEVEKKYKDKINQKDMIISQLDIQLQQYEIKIKNLQKELLSYKIEIEQSKNINEINNITNNNTNINTNNSTSLNSNNIKIINSLLNNSLSNSLKASKNNIKENQKINEDIIGKEKNIDKHYFKNDGEENENIKIYENSEINQEENEEEENIDELLKEVDEEINKSI